MIGKSGANEMDELTFENIKSKIYKQAADDYPNDALLIDFMGDSVLSGHCNERMLRFNSYSRGSYTRRQSFLCTYYVCQECGFARASIMDFR